MGGVSDAATAVAEKALVCKRLRIKILTKKPMISAYEYSKQVPITNSLEKSTSTGTESINPFGNRKLTSSVVGTKRKLEGVDCELERRLKMDRYAKSNCKVILGKLLKHRVAFPFKKPVNPVELCIPDYFDIIKNPMDLGTIKQKLDDNKYRDSEEFESDVRLTFSNAMRYNPPENSVYKYAKELVTFFDHLWKPVKSKMNRQFEGKKLLGSQKITFETTHDSDKNCLKNLASLAVKLPWHGENLKQLNLQKIEETMCYVSQKHLKSISSHVDKLPGRINGKDCEELTEVSIKENSGHCESVELPSSQKIVDETMHDACRKCLKIPSSRVENWPAQGTLSNAKDLQELMEASINKNCHMRGRKDVKDVGSTSSKIRRSDTDTGGGSSENLHSRPVYPVVTVKCENAKESMQERKIPQNEIKVVAVKKNSTQLSRCDDDSYGDASCLDKERACTASGATASGDATAEGFEAVLDVKLSPSKALRAAMLKSRFADTILKAQHKTLLQSGSGTDSLKLQQEKERLERKQREEKAKIEAQIKAAELAARIKAESELKKRREQERIALEKMEQSVDLDDNFHVLRELEALIGRPLFVLCKCRDGRSQAAYLWDQIGADELRSPLEQLGLFIKAEYLAGDGDETTQKEGEWEWEEGEIVY
ncbi:hypothetical protein Cgig2_007617 [Carnegiea gigantea]|uniref:Bromo domain-containing protein n=1 Tax=Carnegiea gigantea TaxID=171969 RepID=A0A9Q1GZS0_9CARY|nr:hypothetical protein Cgig2_007617 [Carnegiea gigantea]